MKTQLSFYIRSITAGDPGLTQVEKLMEETWSRDSLIPEHLTLTLLKNGGLLVGAFEENQLVAFSLGFPGFDGQHTYLCSHLLVVQPKFRHHGIGEMLKWHQRTFALEMGYTKIVWTYDPLETVNGYLNLTKLGAVCRTYIDNCYGDMNDNLNRGLPSDRFWVEWFLEDERANHLSQHETIPAASFDISFAVAAIGLSDGALPQVEALQLDRDEPCLWVPVPKNFQAIKQADSELAKQWRFHVRELFHHYFDSGYVATRLHRVQDGLVHYYLLEKGAIV